MRQILYAMVLLGLVILIGSNFARYRKNNEVIRSLAETQRMLNTNRVRLDQAEAAAAPRPGVTISLHFEPGPEERVEMTVEGGAKKIKTDLLAFWLKTTNGVEISGRSSDVTNTLEDLRKTWNPTKAPVTSTL